MGYTQKMCVDEKSCTKNNVCKTSRNQIGTKFLQGGQMRPGKGINHIDLNSAFRGVWCGENMPFFSFSKLKVA